MEQADIETQRAAKLELEQAIRKYQDICVPGSYLDGYVLITHKLYPGEENAGSSVLGWMPASEQSWVLTRGMVEAALDSIRAEHA